MKTITYKGTKYACPYANILRPLTEGERKSLTDDVRKRGRVICPVLIDAADKSVIDGQHRLEIANKLNVPCPIQEDSYANEQERRELAVSLNVHRHGKKRKKKPKLKAATQPNVEPATAAPSTASAVTAAPVTTAEAPAQTRTSTIAGAVDGARDNAIVTCPPARTPPNDT